MFREKSEENDYLEEGGSYTSEIADKKGKLEIVEKKGVIYDSTTKKDKDIKIS